ncbi:uncharacterized protein LOC114533499 [Dendronephthya gigantea]|uniref:uncharacterized protein LOC114533499 n=1 Tax=Dendronephthya gigantea TaxID=151771 RepID=UPI00106BED99|nr:uncharacterized protein LOC114533499 [Dendronephthya gigantea]
MKHDVPCNDQDSCSKSDKCKNGQCEGISFSCNNDCQSCNGNDCSLHIGCDGVLGTCPPNSVTGIRIQDGQARITLPNFGTPASFQASTNKLYLQLSGFSVTCGSLAIKWSIIKSDRSCYLDKENATLSLNTNTHILGGLNLPNAEIYKVVVQAYNIRDEFGLPVCSNPVTIDTSTPTSGWVHDGLGSTDLQFQSSMTFSATWGGFQSLHGIAKYEVAMQHQPRLSNNQSEVQAFMNVYLNVSFSKTLSVIPDGSKLTTKVRAYTKAGLYSEVSSNGLTVDTSKPFSGSVSDGSSISQDLQYADWRSSYSISWEQFTDPHTPIVNYNVGVKRKHGSFLSSGLSSVGLKQKFLVPQLTLVSEKEYCAIVEGENAAGLKTQASSNCLLIDHDPPRPGTVNDGMTDDIDYQSDDTVFYGNWKGFDDGIRGSGIIEYRYILTDQNGGNITSWTTTGLQTNVTIQAIKLADGNTYYITVRAIDRVSHYKDAKSDGVYIDTSHPVYTGKIHVKGEMAQKDGVLIVYIVNEGTLSASWPQFVDTHSGMDKYQWSIFENDTRPSKWNDVTGVNLATKAIFRSLSLANNTAYRLIIRGINNAGLHADIMSPVIIPIAGSHSLGMVFDGRDPSVDIDYVTNTSVLHATWQGFETADVKVRAYFFAVGSCTRGNYHVTNNQFMPVIPPTATSFGIHGLHLVNGQRYCIKIKAENLAGVESNVASSDGFIVDVSPPDLRSAMVLDGLEEDDIDHQSKTMELSATWTGIQDHESGIQHFEVAVSRSRTDQPDITSFIDVNYNMSSTISGLRLNNEVYYFILCAINNAGLRSCLASDGVLIDPTPPTTGIVHDGILEPDIRYQSSIKEISANWERVWDLESRIERFEWGINEEGRGLVQDFVDVGLQTHVTSNKVLNLKHGHNYTVILRVYNRAGAVQELSSNGVIIDTTPPVSSEIKPLPSHLDWRFVEETETYYSSTATDICVTWEDFQELESEMWYYKIAIGTSKYGTQLQSLTNIGSATNANTSGNGLNIRPGIHYFVTVVGRNRANLVSGNCSSPFLFDFSPPETGKIQIKSDSGLVKKHYSLGESIRVSWLGFQDPESKIEKYEISVVHNSSAILNYTLKPSQTEEEIFIDTSLLYPGKSYNIVLKSKNYAGLESLVLSTPFTIDNTPPDYTGKRDELPKRYFRSNTHPFKIVWEAFEDYESPVEYYEIGIGRHNSGDDTLNFTSTDLCTHFNADGLFFKENQVYYVTVKAFNKAGLSSSLLLEEVNFDQSPPTGGMVKDGVSNEDVDFMSLQDTVSASLEDVKDVESGIHEIEYCVGSTPFNCFIKPFTSILKNNSFTCSDCNVDAGMTAFAVFRVTNGVNLSKIFVSDGVTVDSTPPEIQLVYDGEETEYPDVEKSFSNWIPTVTWNGARDIHSGLRNCKWAILKKEGNTTLSVYVRTLHEANMTYNTKHIEKATAQLSTNSSYVNVIQCWNNAGLSSQRYSNGWSVVEQWPIPSYVIDGTGPHDMEYDINRETLGASWGAFHADSKDPIIKYEWAVGTLGEYDNILEFTDVVLNTKISQSLSESDVTVKPGVKYYTTVRGTTLSGWSSNKTSNGFIIDITPPTAGSVSLTHRILNQKTNDVDYTISWQGFADLESGIQNYAYCLGYIENVCSTSVLNAGSAFQGTVHGFLPEDLENSFFGIIIVTNKAGLKTIASSSNIRIDFTPPVPGNVFDGIDHDLDYINSSVALATSWSAFTEAESSIKKCILTVSEEYPNKNESFTVKLEMEVNANGSVVHHFPMISGLQYVSRITCKNHDGFESSKQSNGVTVDDTPPSVGTILDKNGQNFSHQYQASTGELHVRWTNGYDLESGIMEYLIAVGTGSSEDNIHEFFSVGLAREINVKNLTMNSGSTYYITLQVVNKAGISSRVSSNGITIDNTPPKFQQVCMIRNKNNFLEKLCVFVCI